MATPVVLFDVAGNAPLIGVRMRHRSACVGVNRGVLQCFVCTTRKQCPHVEFVHSKIEVPPEDLRRCSVCFFAVIYDTLLRHK